MVRTEALRQLLLDCGDVEDGLRRGDAAVHLKVCWLLVQLDGESVVNESRELRRLYRWLDAGERSTLEARCPAWKIFASDHPVAAELPFLDHTGGLQIAADAESWLARH